MANKICPICNAEYDDEINKICPKCGYTEETSEESNLVSDVEEVDVEQPAEVVEDVAEEGAEEGAEDAVAADAQVDEASDAEPEDGVSKKTLTIVASVLAILVVVVAVWLVYQNFFVKEYDKLPATMSNYEKFGIDDVSGKFADEESGLFYIFTKENATVEVPVAETEEDLEANSAAEDPEAASDGEEKIKTVTETFDGTYEGGIDESVLPEMVAEYYVQDNQKTDDYKAYLEENNISGDDYLGYVNARGIKAEVDAYDAEAGITEYYKNYKFNGYWRFADGQIKLYGTQGEESSSLIPTAYGLANSNLYFEGEMAGGKKFAGKFARKDEGTGFEQIIHVYDDGHCILENITEGESQLTAGTCEVNGNEAVISFNGQPTPFRITGKGISAYMFAKVK